MNQVNNISEWDKSQPVFLGIDVHKKKWSVCVIHQERIVGQYTIPAEFSALQGLCERYLAHNTVGRE